MARSSLLIVVCSPETSKSKWVRREITLFQELGKGDRIIPHLVAGEPDESFPAELLRRRAERTPPDGAPEAYWEEFEPVIAGSAGAMPSSSAHQDRLRNLLHERIWNVSKAVFRAVRADFQEAQTFAQRAIAWVGQAHNAWLWS